MTLLEVAVVLAIVSALLGIAYSSLTSWQRNERTTAFVRSVADLYRFAAAEAVRKESVQIVFLAAGGAGDPIGTALLDGNGDSVPILLLDDGPAADQDTAGAPGTSGPRRGRKRHSRCARYIRSVARA